MALDDASLLRLYLGESIPSGGTDADTLFSNEDINELLEQTDSVEQAAALGWRAKAAELSRLVDVSEGPSKRYLQQRFENALAMSKQFGSPSSGTTRLHQLTRPNPS